MVTAPLCKRRKALTRALRGLSLFAGQAFAVGPALYDKLQAQLVEYAFKQLSLLVVKAVLCLACSISSTSMLCLARGRSTSVAPVSGLGTSPRCTSADEASERIKVENVTSGMGPDEHPQDFWLMVTSWRTAPGLAGAASRAMVIC